LRSTTNKKRENTVINLDFGTIVPWVGFEDTQETVKGPIVFSSWGMRDGWTLYESTQKNGQDVPTFFIITDCSENKIFSVIEIEKEESSKAAWDKIDKGKKEGRRLRR
jgi:hypothetical protein